MSKPNRPPRKRTLGELAYNYAKSSDYADAFLDALYDAPRREVEAAFCETIGRLSCYVSPQKPPQAPSIKSEISTLTIAAQNLGREDLACPNCWNLVEKGYQHRIVDAQTCVNELVPHGETIANR